MFLILFYIIIILIGNSFLFLEEETLILVVALILLDCVGGLVREFFVFELENRGVIIKNIFKWYLNSKKNLLKILLNKYKQRKDLYFKIDSLYNLYIDQLLNIIIIQYYEDFNIVFDYDFSLYIINEGLELSNSILFEEVVWLLEVVDDVKYTGEIFSYQSPIIFADELLSIEIFLDDKYKETY